MGKGRWMATMVLVGLSAGLALPAGAREAGPALLWNTFLGGADLDEGYAVVADAGGNLCVAGTSFGS